jgi:hypothetical protein
MTDVNFCEPTWPLVFPGCSSGAGNCGWGLSSSGAFVVLNLYSDAVNFD